MANKTPSLVGLLRQPNVRKAVLVLLAFVALFMTLRLLGSIDAEENVPGSQEKVVRQCLARLGSAHSGTT